MSTVDLIIPIQQIPENAFGYLKVNNVPHRKRKIINARIPVPGAYGSTKLVVNLLNGGTAIRVRGSLFKSVYGQNAIVSNFYKSHVRKGLLPLLKRELEKLFPDVNLVWDCERPIWVRRADLVWHFDCGSQVTVLKVLAELLCHAAQKGILAGCKSAGKWPTVTFKLPGCQILVRFYGKHAELHARGHGIPSNVPNGKEIVRAMRGHLRVEATLRRDDLKRRGLDNLDEWNLDKTLNVLADVMQQLNLKAAITLPSMKQLYRKLPKSLLSTIAVWQVFGTVRGHIPPSTFYRHRKELLKYGIDINTLPLKKLKRSVQLRDIFNDTKRVRMVKLGRKYWCRD